MVIDILIFIFIASFIAIVALGHDCWSPRSGPLRRRRPARHAAIPPPAWTGV